MQISIHFKALLSQSSAGPINVALLIVVTRNN